MPFRGEWQRQRQRDLDSIRREPSVFVLESEHARVHLIEAADRNSAHQNLEALAHRRGPFRNEGFSSARSPVSKVWSGTGPGWVSAFRLTCKIDSARRIVPRLGFSMRP